MKKTKKKRTSREIPIYGDLLEEKIKRIRAALIAALIRSTPKPNATRKGKQNATRH